MRTPICRRALGLLLLDWSSEVLNHSPGSIQARWETLSVKQGSCLWWLVRGKDTAPNAPKVNCLRRHLRTEQRMMHNLVTMMSS